MNSLFKQTQKIEAIKYNLSIDIEKRGQCASNTKNLKTMKFKHVYITRIGSTAYTTTLQIIIAELEMYIPN